MLIYYQKILYPLLSSTGILEYLYACQGYGGVFQISCQNLRILNNTFVGNINKFAGVGYLLPHEEDFFSDILIQKNLFKSNRAGENSGVFLFSSEFIKVNCYILENVFDSNLAKSIFYIFYIYFILLFYKSGWNNQRLFINEYLIFISKIE